MTTSLSEFREVTQRVARRNIRAAIATGLESLRMPVPLSACEWSEQNGYLPAESNYVEGRFVALKYQVALLNMMGNPDIREFTWVKSARVGATLLLQMASGFMLENRKQTVMLFQPTDDDADNFSKLSVDPFIRDVPKLRALFPWLNKKHKHNTTNLKVFSNGAVWHVKGGKSPRAYRRVSADTVMLDELSGFDRNIGGNTKRGEGNARKLAAKRVEGAVNGKVISTSTPKVLHECLVTEAYDESEWKLTFHIPCPKCGEPHDLHFGDRDTDFGLKWNHDDAGNPIYASAKYMCPHCHGTYTQAEFVDAADHGVWRSPEGYWTEDGDTFYDRNNQHVQPPEHVGAHIWTIYSPWVQWKTIVKEFYQARGDVTRLQTFSNITLGQAFDTDPGEKVDKDTLAERAIPLDVLPSEVVLITFGADLQANRAEIEVNGWGPGEERYVLDYIRFPGDPTRDLFWNELGALIRSLSYKREDGVFLEPVLGCFDSGYLADHVYRFSKMMGVQYVIPTKGASTYGSPIVKFPKTPSADGLYLTLVGTDTAKELITRRWRVGEPGPGYTHFANSPTITDTDYFAMLTSEVRKRKRVGHQDVIYYDNENRRNEAFDTHVANLVAARIAQQNFGVQLGARSPVTRAPSRRPKTGVRGGVKA